MVCGLFVDGLWVYGLWVIQKLRAFKNPAGHLIIRIIACPHWTHVRIQTMEAKAKSEAKFMVQMFDRSRKTATSVAPHVQFLQTINSIPMLINLVKS